MLPIVTAVRLPRCTGTMSVYRVWSMRRFIALAMIAALVSVSSLPLLPKPLVCVHAAERLADCTSCHNKPAAMMQHAGRHQSAAMHAHHQRLSPAAQHCRIECGCGCHASQDGLPHQLAPHTLPPVSWLRQPVVVMAPMPSVTPLASVQAAPPSPPPKPVFSELS